MPRPRKPWFRKNRPGVYVEIGGKQHLLAKGPDNDETWERAQLAYHQLMAEVLANPPVEGGDPTVASVVDEFLEFSVKRDAPSTFYERKLYLQNFCTHHGPRLVRDCKPLHLSKWVDKHPKWISDWTKHYAMRCVVRPFNWAVKGKLIEENPFTGVTWPKCDGQRRPMSSEEYEALLKAAGKTSRLGEILRFLWNTGCRPSELRHLWWQDIHLKVPYPAIILKEHKTSRTQRTPNPRVIPLVQEVVDLLSEIAARQEHDEFVFVTHRRTPWARSSIQQTLRRLRRKIGLPEDVVLYGCRIHVGTYSIRNGNDLRTTADLLGHKHVRTTERYIHPTDQIDQLAAAMLRATRSA
jgi:integrase